MNESSLQPDPGSFRDPSGRVYSYQGNIYRSVTPHAAPAFRKVWESGILQALSARGLLIETDMVAEDHPARLHFGDTIDSLLSHPALPLVSYPYEWTFSALKQAALAHLHLHMELLSHGFTLSDASAYNMQFDGAHPLHIDVLSIIPYTDGTPWAGYRQFLQHFLNPLLTEAYAMISFAPLLRSMPDGISSQTTLRLLPWHATIRPGCLLHVALPAAGERHYQGRPAQGNSKPPYLAKTRLIGMLKHLRSIIEGLTINTSHTTWASYNATTSYTKANADTKKEMVRSFIANCQPDLLLDIGCNNGEYAALALASGAARVIGIDTDRGALENCFRLADSTGLCFTPLAIDITNPSPAQGWRGTERRALASRIRPDALLAMAVLHHICIANNIPLDEAMAYLTSLAPRGMIEFVPKSDPMVHKMLRHREDIFINYTLANTKACLQKYAHIRSELQVGDSGRTILVFERL